MIVDEIPETFKLVIGSNRACSEVGCVVARHRADRVGVRYVGQFRTVMQRQRVPANRR